MRAARRSRLIASPGLAVALIAFGAPAGLGQELRGRVIVDGSAGEPVDGALVSLLGESGTVADGAFSDPSGFFLLQPGLAGTYRVRIERIGFESWTSEPLSLGASDLVQREFALPIRPVRLAAIDVAIRSQCVDDPRDEAQFEVVWDEARKALEAAQLAQREKIFRFNSVIFDREVSARDLRIWRVETTAADGVVETPFQSLPAARLSADGYIQEDGETIYYYAPDAGVLLSEEFFGDHCFGLDREEEDGRRLIGITFEPRDDRRLPDISGVLWLDEESAELDRVEFEYERIPYRGVRDDRIRGEVEYVRLPGGAFAVRDWYIRMPVLSRLEGRDRFYLEGFTEYGGQLRDVMGPDGGPVAWLAGGVIQGTIVNSLTGRPLADATVIVDRPRGRDLEGHTGPRGEYLFHGLAPGRHRVTFTHPMLVPIDWAPGRQEVELGVADVADVSFALPEPEEIRADLCGRDATGGVLLGRVTDRMDGLIRRRVQVQAEWDPSLAAGGGPSGEVARESDRTRLDGRYKLCDLPLGVDLSVFLEGSDGGFGGRRLRLQSPVAVVDFALDRRR